MPLAEFSGAQPFGQTMAAAVLSDTVTIARHRQNIVVLTRHSRMLFRQKT
jgi:hypothetical protein